MTPVETIHALTVALRAGYCLHGSPLPLKQISPQPAVCLTGDPNRNLNAIYADPSDFRVPVIMATLSPKNPLCDWHTKYRSMHDRIYVSGTNVMLRAGFVYVLPSRSFEWRGCEFVSYDPVTPDDVIVVHPDIVPLLTDVSFKLRPKEHAVA